MVVSLNGGIQISGGDIGFSEYINDPYYSNVSLLMHYDGINNSTIFTDQTGIHTFTRTGSSVISTTESKFGDSSLFVPASSKISTTVPNTSSNLYLNADFTIECWIFPTTTSTTSQWVIDLGDGNGVGFGAYLINWNSINLNVTFNSSSNNTSYNLGTMTSPANTAPMNTWTHVAVTRSTNNWYLFINGQLKVTTTGSGTPTSATLGNGFHIGGDSVNTSTRAFRGYIDEVRITKGIARYTSDFDIPTHEYPNN